jgi:tetratricopeptide (TPR) repeat protein
LIGQQDIVDADEQGRYLDALSLRSDASIDAIRSVQVALVHRFRSQPSVLAAINHAAECAAEERCTSVNPIRVKRLVFEASLPEWGVPASDVVEYLAGSFDLDAVISETARRLRGTGRAGDLELATIDAVLRNLQSEDAKSGMCDWYCRQVGTRLSRAFGKAGSLAELDQSGARALRRELLVCRIKARQAVSLTPGSAHGQSMLDRIEACLREIEQTASGSSRVTERISGLRASARAQVQSGNVEDALPSLRTIVELSDDAESHFDLGSALTRLGRFDEALPCLEKAAELRGCSQDLGSVEACRASLTRQKGRAAFEGGVAALDRGDAPSAVGLFRQATISDPCGEYYHWLGRAMARLGRLDDALPFFEQAARLRGDPADTTWLAEIRSQLVRRRPEPVPDASEPERAKSEDAPANVQVAEVSPAWGRALRLSTAHVIGITFSLLTHAAAIVLVALVALTREAIVARLLASICLMAASAGIGIWVARSLVRRSMSVR